MGPSFALNSKTTRTGPFASSGARATVLAAPPTIYQWRCRPTILAPSRSGSNSWDYQALSRDLSCCTLMTRLSLGSLHGSPDIWSSHHNDKTLIALPARFFG